MKQIKQRDLKKGMLVSDVDCTEIGDLFLVMKECTNNERLGLKLMTDNSFYKNFTTDGLNYFGSELLYGDVNWFIPTKEEIELIKNRDK